MGLQPVFSSSFKMNEKIYENIIIWLNGVVVSVALNTAVFVCSESNDLPLSANNWCFVLKPRQSSAGWAKQIPLWAKSKAKGTTVFACFCSFVSFSKPSCFRSVPFFWTPLPLQAKARFQGKRRVAYENEIHHGSHNERTHQNVIVLEKNGINCGWNHRQERRKQRKSLSSGGSKTYHSDEHPGVHVGLRQGEHITDIFSEKAPLCLGSATCLNVHNIGSVQCSSFFYVQMDKKETNKLGHVVKHRQSTIHSPIQMALHEETSNFSCSRYVFLQEVTPAAQFSAGLPQEYQSSNAGCKRIIFCFSLLQRC